MQVTKHILKELKEKMDNMKTIIQQNEIILKKSKIAYNKLEKEYIDLEEFSNVVNTKDYHNYIANRINKLQNP